MKPFLVKSPEEKIPLFSVDYSSGESPIIVFLNSRTKVTDSIPVADYIDYILSSRLCGDHEMAFSPNKGIPLHAYVHDEFGFVFIEVKRKGFETERIPIMDYIKMLRRLEKTPIAL